MRKSLNVLLLGVALTGIVNAQDDSSEWRRVTQIDINRRVEVRTVAEPSQKIRGRLLSTSDDSVSLLEKSGVQRTFMRDEIERLRLRRKDTAPIAGAVAGGALGALGAGIGGGGGSGENAAGVVVMVAVGWLIGKGVQRGKWRTIYEAPLVPRS